MYVRKYIKMVRMYGYVPAKKTPVHTGYLTARKGQYTLTVCAGRKDRPYVWPYVRSVLTAHKGGFLTTVRDTCMYGP